MWRDEIQAWLIARDSATISQLLTNLKYEGHPGLWHLLITPLTRWFEPPESIQYVHWLIATASIYLLNRFSPFTWPQKTLLTFSYFLFYEYALISRNYALGVFFIFLFCTLFRNYRKYTLLIAGTLFLLSHTSILGLIFSAVALVTVIIDLYFTGKNNQTADAKPKFQWVSIGIVITGIVTAYIQIKPPADTGLATVWRFYPDTAIFKETVSTLINAYFPIPKFTIHYWNTRYFHSVYFFGPLAFLTFFLFAKSLAKKPAAEVLLIGVTIASLAFFYTKYSGMLRHHGFLFIALIAAFWIAPFCACKNQSETSRPSFRSRLAKQALSFILIIHATGGLLAAYLDARHSFSGAREAARFIRSNSLENLPIIANPSPQTSTIAGFLVNAQFFYPETGKVGSFVIWNNQRSAVVDDTALEFAKYFAFKHTDGALFICNKALSPSLINRFHLEAIYSTETSVVDDEQFFIYRLRHPQ